MRDDQLDELKRMQEVAIDHAIEAIDAADTECDISSKEGRGNRVWLTKAANEGMKLACAVERLLQMRGQGKEIADPDREIKNAEAVVQRAQRKFAEYTGRKS